MRAVLDTNVIVSAVLSRQGTPARILRAWANGAFEMIVSPMLIDELRRVLAYPKLAVRITAAEAEDLVTLIERGSVIVDDPGDPPEVRSSDPGDDYLIALAATTRSIIVTGDSDLLELSNRIPVLNPVEFAASLP